MKEATFKYKGKEVTFGGFYEDKFAFNVGTKIVFVETIQELENLMSEDSND